ncbi:MAG: EAL domain-containing protein [Pseudomonadales bacterium]|nr:EAL domain-containing protein [Pseudomonadales bacterium]
MKLYSHKGKTTPKGTWQAKKSRIAGGFLLLVYSLIFYSGQAFSFTLADLEAIEVNETTHQLTIRNIAWTEDRNDNYRVDEFLGKKAPEFTLTKESPNFGHSNSSFWVSFKLHYASQSAQPEKKTWLVELPYPPLQRVALHIPDSNGHYQAFDLGYDNAMSTRRIAHRHFVFPITLEPNQSKMFFLNVMRKGGSVQAPLNLWSQEQFLMQDGTQNYIMGIFYGTMLAMILYNAFLYVSLRSKSYLYYIVYMTFSALAYLSLSGYGFLYLWPESPHTNTLVIPLVCTLAAVSGCLFFKAFTALPEHYRKANIILNMLLGCGLGLVALILISKQLLSLWVVLYIGLCCVFVLWLSVYFWIKGSRQAGFFLLAWTAFILGTLVFLSLLMGWLPSNIFTRHGLQLGCMSEVLLLSFALADQIHHERKQKYMALEEQHKTVVKLQDMESQLMHRALHSRSTGIPNRALLRRSLDQYFHKDHTSGKVGLFVISLDNFHEFNKTLGHSTGDAILKLVTHRLSDLISQFKNAICFEITETHSHSLANVEGVTFGFALKVATDDSALEQAAIVLQAFERPFEYQGMILDVESTIGVSMFPEHGENTDGLLRNAHIALEAASTSNNKIALYSSQIDPYSAKRLSLIAELKSAIEQNELQLYFQPQMNLKENTVTGAEVLIRWIHSEHGFIPPDEFIPLAERTGVIQPLTYWICENAFAALDRFKQQGFNLSLSINISARNLQDRLFQSTILQMAEKAQLSTKEFILELTETAVMVNPEEALEMLNALSRTGITLSIDDFGTGYSSLSYLKRLPVKEIKIDRTFVMDMAKNQDDKVIVDTTLQMAHNLGLIVVAEGIEDQDTLSHLTQLGCDYAQGYHIARPMPEHEFTAWLKQYQSADCSAATNAQTGDSKAC